MSNGISIPEAEEKARVFIDAIPRRDMKGWRYKFVGVVNKDPTRDWWGVVFDTFSPEGDFVDGPVIVAVRRSDGLTLFVDEAFEKGLLP